MSSWDQRPSATDMLDDIAKVARAKAPAWCTHPQGKRVLSNVVQCSHCGALLADGPRVRYDR